MTPKQYRAALAALDLSQERAALLFGYGKRVGQQWAALSGYGPPSAVAILVRLIRSGKVTAEDIKAARK